MRLSQPAHQMLPLLGRKKKGVRAEAHSVEWSHPAVIVLRLIACSRLGLKGLLTSHHVSGARDALLFHLLSDCYVLTLFTLIAVADGL
ncbi:hypothetical protein NDU88_004795 [Pleurodeles waltl]|uniref:Uncharacterized protein n=1 Tax=Pleurodeles waltl TaxID=8319 RepID=A0AAV7RGN1_PLEWA|nr:hypothetical protein NDU88_004795 [Pleurodeles waltl]